MYEIQKKNVLKRVYINKISAIFIFYNIYQNDALYLAVFYLSFNIFSILLITIQHHLSSCVQSLL